VQDLHTTAFARFPNYNSIDVVDHRIFEAGNDHLSLHKVVDLQARFPGRSNDG